VPNKKPPGAGTGVELLLPKLLLPKLLPPPLNKLVVVGAGAGAPKALPELGEPPKRDGAGAGVGTPEAGVAPKEKGPPEGAGAPLAGAEAPNEKEVPPVGAGAGLLLGNANPDAGAGLEEPRAGAEKLNAMLPLFVLLKVEDGPVSMLMLLSFEAPVMAPRLCRIDIRTERRTSDITLPWYKSIVAKEKGSEALEIMQGCQQY
jgi:hypothetical protein